MKNNYHKLLLCVLAFGNTFSLVAQTADNAAAQVPVVSSWLQDPNLLIYALLLIAIIAVIGVVWTMYKVINGLLEELRMQHYKDIGKLESYLAEKKAKQSTAATIMHELTQAVSVEDEKSIEFDHEYDGIRELDNKLPPWWVWMFYLSIVFAVVYIFYYHVSGVGKLPLEELKYSQEQAEIAKAEYLKKAANLIDETNVTLATDESTLALGKEIYTTNCVPCHGAFGEGGVGPTFADQYWIHGGSINDVFKTVRYGVPSKGMVSWQEQGLRPGDIRAVSSYLLQFQGTHPDNMKEPEGSLYVPGGKDAPQQAPDSLQTASVQESAI
ncbi:MAG: cbb3-type cytochrome c oxidase N-terminal domain-containing protein [Chitinophagales bacterium]|nr:c-type cytochrome [Bacteroidota bacterium]MCB9044303.1 c-type cytochrome [Chitinophagales bacterium]